MTVKHIDLVAQKTGLPLKKVENTIQLLNEGATIPFIARYRKEVTGSLDEVEILDIKKGNDYFLDLEKRKETILSAIDEQGKLSPELAKVIKSCFDATRLEDIYLPYKKKRKTRAMKARELGLEPFAQKILSQKIKNPHQLAANYVKAGVSDGPAAVQGAMDIIAEWVNEDEQSRKKIRGLFNKVASVRSKVLKGKDEEGQKYKDYFAFEEPLSKCPSHRILALFRGEQENILRLRVEPPTEDALYRLNALFLEGNNDCTEIVRLAIEDAYKRLLLPSIENEFRNKAKEKADKEAIKVFAENLRELLLAAPLGEKRVLALDPGFRTGCKMVCLDEQGDLIYNTAIYPNPPQSKYEESARQVKEAVKKYNIEVFAIGNGTAGRETETFIKSLDFGKSLEVFLVDESGASIYSASDIARKEFPKEDITVRGAVSIGRRLMDPLAELVKIDAKSIGVGQYQHDVNQVMLRDELGVTVESCVNKVGINLNTASEHVLTYVSGLGAKLAENIVKYRAEIGSFSSRAELKKVPRMGAKAYEQAAGFLRIRDAKNPLDNTGVHPESYKVVKQMAKDAGCDLLALIDSEETRKSIRLNQYISAETGLPTLQDIMKELAKPGLDPRGEAASFSFDPSLRTIADVREGMIIPGIVKNVTNFGAFIDIGIKESGLVHVSQLADRYVSNPMEVVKVHQKVTVKVTGVDLDRQRIALTMKGF